MFRRTVQQFVMDDDLCDTDPNFGYGGKAITGAFRLAGAVWPAANSRIDVSIYADAQQQLAFQVLMAGDAPVASIHGAATAETPLTTAVDVQQEGRYLLQAKLSNPADPPARLYIKVDYLGPATSTLF